MPFPHLRPFHGTVKLDVMRCSVHYGDLGFHVNLDAADLKPIQRCLRAAASWARCGGGSGSAAAAGAAA